MLKNVHLTPSIDINIEYLMYYLEDELRDVLVSEFSSRENVRIHPIAPSTTQKSPDLPQDYDPNENHLHLMRGVRVKAGSRDFFFPASWVTENRMDLIQAQALEIREFCKSKSIEN